MILRLIRIIAITIFIGVLLYRELPPGIAGKDRWKLQIIELAFRLFYGPIPVFHLLGLDCFEIQLMRSTRDFLFWVPQKRSTPELQVNETTFDGIRVRIYTPRDRISKGAILYFHGGGFVIMSIDSFEYFTYSLSKRSGLIVIAVEYRRAPEYTFPAAPNDCEIATRYLMRKGYKEWDIDPTLIAVMGDSAGGNLATVTAQRLTKSPEAFKLKAQVIIYPIVQLVDVKLPSYLQSWSYYRTGLIDAIRTFRSMMVYLGLPVKYVSVIVAGQHVHRDIARSPLLIHLNRSMLPRDYLSGPITVPPELPFLESGPSRETIAEAQEDLKRFLLNSDFSPLFARSLKGMPNTHIVTCGYDILRDEDTLYAQRLRDAGVEVNLRHYEGGYHGMINAFAFMEPSSQAVHDAIDYLRTVLT